MSANPAIKPFQIAVPDAALERLKAKLSLATFPEETSFSNDPAYGAPLDDVKRLVGVWRDSYDWRAAEAELNAKLPQFTTTVSVDGHEDLTIHFVHQRSESPDAIPLLFCHGWPGSFIEVLKILPLLTSSKDPSPSFHVVAPSLPNYGFSSATRKPGFGLPQYAETCHKLMQRLGYARYATQGGDWGYFITRAMGALYAPHVLASHVNFFLTPPPSLLSTPLLVLRHVFGQYTPSEKAGLARLQQYRRDGGGYAAVQGSKPHTLGVGLADSPALLVAWVYEKLAAWTDDAHAWADAEVLTWVAVYAFAAAGPDASVRIYYEVMHPPTPADAVERFYRYNAAVPLGVSSFPKDVMVMPTAWARAFLGPVVFEKRHEEGGHFAAYEVPELLAADLKTMFGKKDGIGEKVQKALGS